VPWLDQRSLHWNRALADHSFLDGFNLRKNPYSKQITEAEWYPEDPGAGSNLSYPGFHRSCTRTAALFTLHSAQAGCEPVAGAGHEHWGLHSSSLMLQ